MMSACCGLAVANLYYNQPLLADIARDLHVDQAQVGSVAATTQLGYALGILAFVPLGDAFDRRKLVARLALITAAGLAAIALAPNLPFLAIASFAVGCTTVIAQILIPYAAFLSPPEQRGHTVGRMITGVLLGVLLARTISGFIGQHLGWRAVYWIAAAVCVALSVFARVALPKVESAAKVGWSELVGSLLHLVRTSAPLRQSSMVGAGLFGSLTAFWTVLAFRLAAPPYHYGAGVAGSFGLIGAISAVVTPMAGRASDRRGPGTVINYATGAAVVSYLLFWSLGSQLWGMVVGVLLLDAAVQSAQVANQLRIFSIGRGAESRINTIYMICYFIGGALGSAASTAAWGHFGWSGVCLIGMLFSSFALLVNARKTPAESGNELAVEAIAALSSTEK
jgi:predicted MFS family arabinose efflux permease